MTDGADKRLTWVLGILVVISALGVVYASATPDQRIDPYTELYLEGLGGNASDYPQSLTVGESGRLTVGVSNHETRRMEYTLVFRLDNETVDSRTISVEGGETWESEQSFAPESAGRKRFNVLLYRGLEARTTADPYETVYLWVTVREP